MAISSIVGRGFGAWGSTGLTVTRGYGGASMPVPERHSVVGRGWGAWGSTGLITTRGYGIPIVPAGAGPEDLHWSARPIADASIEMTAL